MCSTILLMLDEAEHRHATLADVAGVMNGDCRACHHPERKDIDRALLLGHQSPRSAARRYSDLTRKDLTHHLGRCLATANEGGGG